ncbi:MAG: isochorismatase family protein [Synergistaceae bacterium]|jgi:nicotinamidase-related amidase|nr:isochorismatase family protein [Synergistaceae bacterium]
MSTDALVIIDPQNDFCDRRGSLCVEGAEADIVRLSRYIEKAGSAVSGIFVSLDSHDGVAIFHPSFWVNGAGEHPAPFTQITPEDFGAEKWKVVSNANEPFAARTFEVMKKKGIESLMVWPEHCVVSTWGHQIADPLLGALADWREKTGLPVRYVFKGENPYTDQFSVFEGLDDSYPETAFNERLFAQLARFDQVTFAGEALSHCVRESILSCVRRLGKTKQPAVRLLVDCTSPVGGFDAKHSLDLLRETGVTFISSGSGRVNPD